MVNLLHATKSRLKDHLRSSSEPHLPLGTPSPPSLHPACVAPPLPDKPRLSDSRISISWASPFAKEKETSIAPGGNHTRSRSAIPTSTPHLIFHPPFSKRMSAPAPPRDASNPALSPASAPSSTRPAPSSPVLSRKSSTVRPTSNPVLTPAPASDLPAKRRHIIVYDFAYPNSDDRHRGLVLDTGNHGSNRSSASSGVTGFFGFRLNPFKSLAVPSEGVDGEGANSQRSSRASASSTSSTYHDAPEYSDEDEEGADRIAGAGAPPFRPGIYRAMYDFEPEGDAEMGLSEGQLVRVLGRGGGEGWVVVSDPDKGNGQALVPEGYLEFSHADEEDGGTTPADV